MKTYFNYESIIKSKEAAEAIASPLGVGPFCGFGSATIANQKITLLPEGVAGSLAELSIKDRILARTMYKGEDDIAQTNFGVIARDGTIWTDSVNSISVDIQGTQGTTDNVIVYAVHTTVKEPVENPVSFVAYWNSSSTNFYDLYKKATDPYYPRSKNTNGTVLDPKYTAIDVLLDSELTYENLSARAKAACPSGQIDDNTMVLVGIYGSGINAETETTEQFAIVPYLSQFPQPVNFTTATYGLSKVQSQVVEKLVEDMPVDITTIREYIDYLFDQKFGKEEDSTLNALPTGAIIMWSGATLPEGWAYCDGLEGRPNLMGKFIAGYNPSDPDYATIGQTGGSAQVTLTIDQMPEHRHDLYYRDAKWGDNANNRPAPNNDNNTSGEPWAQNITTGPSGGGQPHENRPPYYVLAYIIKL